jgi:hypothetical protein
MHRSDTWHALARGVRLDLRGSLGDLVAGLVGGLTLLFGAIAPAAAIFTGALEPYLSVGIGLSVFTVTVSGVVLALFSRYPAALGGAQLAPAVGPGPQQRLLDVAGCSHRSAASTRSSSARSRCSSTHQCRSSGPAPFSAMESDSGAPGDHRTRANSFVKRSPPSTSSAPGAGLREHAPSSRRPAVALDARRLRERAP